MLIDPHQHNHSTSFHKPGYNRTWVEQIYQSSVARSNFQTNRKRSLDNNIPLRIVHLSLRPEKMSLTLFIGIIPAHLIPVFLGIKQRDEMNARPDSFAGDFAAHGIQVSYPRWNQTGGRALGRGRNALSFTGSKEVLVPPVAHDCADAEDVVDRAETAGWEVALQTRRVELASGCNWRG